MAKGLVSPEMATQRAGYHALGFGTEKRSETKGEEKKTGDQGREERRNGTSTNGVGQFYSVGVGQFLSVDNTSFYRNDLTFRLKGC